MPKARTKPMMESGHKPTLSDIAREVGVSTTTVINVMKGRGSEVSAKTSAKIMRVVNRVGYVKNLTASALSSDRSMVIAVVLAGAFEHHSILRNLESNPFYGDFILRMEHAARLRGYSINLFAGEEEAALAFLLQRSQDAVVLLGVGTPYLPDQLIRHHLPLILVDTFMGEGTYTRVCGDEALGARLAAEHLLARGCRKLVFVGDVHEDRPRLIPTLRYRAAEAACKRASRTLDLIKAATSFDDGADVASRVVAAKYDGVVTGADIVAAGLVQGLRHAAVKVPDQVAVVGYDNLLVAKLCLPHLTTVDQQLDEKINAVLDLVQQPSPGAHVSVPPTLVVRESA